MNILFTSLREKSHLLALTPFIAACVRRGHAVAVAAPDDFAERVGALGARFFPVAHPGDHGLQHIWAKFQGKTGEEITRIAHGELFAGACAQAALPSVLEIITQFQPAIVLRESHEFAGPVAAEKCALPHACVAITAPGSEARIREHAAEYVEILRQRAGLSSDPHAEKIRDEPVLTLFPPSFDRSEAGLYPQFHARTEAHGAAPLPDWWPGSIGPFVYVTLGTVTGRFDALASVYLAILDAVAGLPVRVLLTVGAELSVATLGEIPANVHVEAFVPQDDVLPHASAVLIHGGSGTMLAALAQGLPMVVLPLFADQPHNARCAVARGAGLALDPGDTTPERIRAALTQVLGEPSFRDAAEALARETAALPSLDEAVDEIERIARTR